MPRVRASATALDRLIGWFNPRAGLYRIAHREALARAYEGASKADGWRVKRAGASPNVDFSADGRECRVRARALYQNVPFIHRGVNSRVGDAIGWGLVPRVGHKNEAARVAFTDAFTRWSQGYCDADGRANFSGLIAQAYRAYRIDGEVLIRLRERPMDTRSKNIPLQLQVIEADYIDDSKNGNSPSNAANTIINGIEYDAIGRVLGYWLFAQHPGEYVRNRRIREESKFVPAASVIHFYRAERPGQGRGISSLASIIASARDLQTYADSEAQRKNLASRLAVIGHGNIADLAQDAPGVEGATTASGRTTELGELAGGAVMQMPAGVSGITVAEPKADPGYTDYVKQQLHLICSGGGFTYEGATGDLRDTNMSSARIGRNNYKRDVEHEQWTDIVPRLFAPIIAAFTEAAYLAGLIPTTEGYSIDWSFPKWDYTNPQDEVTADVDEIKHGLSSLSEKLRVRGFTPEEVFAEIEKDAARISGNPALVKFFAMLRGDPTEPAPEQPLTPPSRRDAAPSELDNATAEFLRSLSKEVAP